MNEKNVVPKPKGNKKGNTNNIKSKTHERS
jgi:hypothetical protein